MTTWVLAKTRHKAYSFLKPFPIHSFMPNRISQAFTRSCLASPVAEKLSPAHGIPFLLAGENGSVGGLDAVAYT